MWEKSQKLRQSNKTVNCRNKKINCEDIKENYERKQRKSTMGGSL